MRIAIGSLMQETNTFLPVPTDMAAFEAVYVRRGETMFSEFGAARVEVTGMRDVLAEAGATPIPLLAAFAGSGGAVSRAAFEALLGEMLARLRDAGPVDGVLMALHGAMVLEDAPDAEGEIIARVRQVVGPGIPIGVSLDLHGHITRGMLQPGTFLVGYQEYPHIDMYETGQRTACLLLDTLAGRRKPVMALAKVPILVSPINARTAEPPLSRIVAAARRMESEGRVLHASLFPVQPWIDVPDLGFATLVCADGDAACAQSAADELAGMAWQARDKFTPDLTPLDEAIRIGLSSEGTTVVGDGGDAPSSGAAADNTAVLRALLAAGADRAGRLSYLTLCDPQAALQAQAAGVGSTVTLRVGHKMSGDGEPLQITARVRALTDGRYIMHDAGAEGTSVESGLTAVLDIGDIRLAIRSQRGLEWDTGLFTSAGLVLRHAALVFVKSPSHFRVAYAPHAARILAADTPGTTTGNMRRLVFRNVTRPLYPLDSFPAEPA
jgi:microcystin degradation protein MlrC